MSRKTENTIYRIKNGMALRLRNRWITVIKDGDRYIIKLVRTTTPGEREKAQDESHIFYYCGKKIMATYIILQREAFEGLLATMYAFVGEGML